MWLVSLCHRISGDRTCKSDQWKMRKSPTIQRLLYQADEGATAGRDAFSRDGQGCSGSGVGLCAASLNTAEPMWEGACPDGSVSANTSVAVRPLSGASPLPHVEFHIQSPVFWSVWRGQNPRCFFKCSLIFAAGTFCKVHSRSWDSSRRPWVRRSS